MNERFAMKQDVERGTVGQSFEDFLKEQGIYEETTARVIKRVLASRLADKMKKERISKAEMAKRLGSSRSQLERLLDPENDGVSLIALARVAKAVGKSLRLELM